MNCNTERDVESILNVLCSMRVWTVDAIVAAWFLLSRCADALQLSAAVEQAIGDGPFVPAGHIKGFIEPQVFILLSRDSQRLPILNIDNALAC